MIADEVDWIADVADWWIARIYAQLLGCLKNGL